MKKTKKIILPVIAVLLFLIGSFIFTAVPAHAEGSGRAVISDDADLLTDDEEAKLFDVMQPVTAYGNIAFKSVASGKNPTTADAFAKSYYQDTFGLTDGAVFLIDMDNRKIYIYCQDAFYQTITSSRSETITDNVYKYASRGEYYECAAEAFREINTLIEGGKIAQPMKYASNALLALILALLINFVVIRVVTRLKAPRYAEMYKNAKAYFEGSPGTAAFTHTTKKYDPIQTGGGGGRGGGGGGFSGGGHSGGGGGHSF